MPSRHNCPEGQRCIDYAKQACLPLYEKRLVALVYSDPDFCIAQIFVLKLPGWCKYSYFLTARML